MDGGNAPQGYEMSGTRLTNRSWTGSAGREGGGRQGQGISALLSECGALLPPCHLTKLKAPGGGVPGGRAWGSSVQATLLFLRCRWTGQGRAKAGPAAAPSCRGCSRMRKLECWFSASHICSSFCSKNYHQVSVIRSFGAAAQGAWMSNTEGQGVLGKGFRSAKLPAGAVGLQRRGNEAM